MINPPLDGMLKKVDSKYTLVVVAAKRARALTEGEEPGVQMKSNKMVTAALQEIFEGFVGYERIREGIK